MHSIEWAAGLILMKTDLDTSGDSYKTWALILKMTAKMHGLN